MYVPPGDLGVLSKHDEAAWVKFCVHWNNQEEHNKPSTPASVESDHELHHDDLATWNDVISNLNTLYPNPSSSPIAISLTSRFVSMRDGLIVAVRLRYRKGRQDRKSVVEGK